MASVNILIQDSVDAKVASLSEDEFLQVFGNEEKLMIINSVSNLLVDVDEGSGYWCLVTDVIPDYIPRQFDGLHNFCLAIPAIYSKSWKFGGCYMFSTDEIDSDIAIEFCKTLFQTKLDIANNLN